MKTLTLLMALALSLCASMSAQESAVETPTSYSFQDVNNPSHVYPAARHQQRRPHRRLSQLQ